MSQLDSRSRAIALVWFYSFLNLYPTQPLLPLFTQIFQSSEVEVSLTVSAATAAVALAAPWAGVFADILGRKCVIVPALFLLIIPTLLAATAPELQALIVHRFLQGLLMAIVAGSTGILLTLIPSFWSVMLGLATSASGTFICQSVATSYVGTAVQEARSSATGLYVAFYYLGEAWELFFPALSGQ